jgi:beta-lactam-binding protein with PASTA domain
MSTPPERTSATEPITVESTSETVETVVEPPLEPPVAPPVPPPPAAGFPAGEQVVVEDVGGAHYVTTPSGERVLVNDPGGTRVVTSGTRTPLPPDEDPRRWNWLTPALVFILLAALGIVLAAVLLTRNNDDKKGSATPTNTVTTTVRSAPTPPPANVSIQVPTLVGQTRGEAERALDRAGLAVVVATVPGAPPAGRVLAQNPSAGQTLKSGDSVRINVSDGQATPNAPATTTQSPQTTTAPAATPQATTPQTTTPQTTPATTAESPTTTAPTNTQPATPAPTPVSVPSLTGTDVKSAVQNLAGKDLAAVINYVPSDEAMGTVVSQSPSAGATSDTGTRITLSVASGPGDKEQATVPDTSGQTIEQAVGTLNSAGLRLILVKKTVTDKEQAGKVVEQTPEPGAKAPKRAQVLVYMGAYKG